MLMTDHDMARAWDALHDQPRFRPAYPSEAVVRFLFRRFNPDAVGSDTRLLDIGVGAGRHLRVMGDLGHRSFGIDISHAGLLHALGNGASSLSVASFTDLPFQDGTFDGAIAYGVLYYGDETSYRHGADELLRVLKPGGRALVVTRSTEDHRFGRGRQVGPTTFDLNGEDTNEQGMRMHFLDRDAIARIFAAASELQVDRLLQTDGGERVVNADWVIEIQR
jgi:SAM-dependent methyltransferase